MTDTKDTIQEENQTASKETLESPSSNEDREKKRMETNRIRAKQIRKRKKEMEEDMRNQIVRLTLENNTLRTQLQVQEAEIKLLRNNMMMMQGNQQSLLSGLDMSSNGLNRSSFGGIGAPGNMNPMFMSGQGQLGGLDPSLLSNLQGNGTATSSMDGNSLMMGNVGAEGDRNEQQLADLLSKSSSHVKKSLLEKLKQERSK